MKSINTMTSMAAPSLRCESPIVLFREGYVAQRNAMWRHEGQLSLRIPTDFQPVSTVIRDRAVASKLGGPPRGARC